MPRFHRVPRIEAIGNGLVAGFSTALPREDDGPLAARILSIMEGGEAGKIPGLPYPLLLDQTHSTHIVSLAARDLNGAGAIGPPPGDGACSGQAQGGMVAVKTADCVPVLAADPETGAYGALHAGWRGAAKGILPALLESWQAAGSSLREVELVFGPHIRRCCYEVGEECLAEFSPGDLDGATERDGSKPHLDLASVLSNQAARHGIDSRRMEVSAHCTRCHTFPDGRHPYASYRRATAEGSALVDTNVGVIGMALVTGNGG